MTITTVILIVLGLAVLVMLVIGFTKGWDFFFGIFDSGPSDLQTVAKACIGYVEASLSIDFCKYRLIDIDGKDELVNCNDGRIVQSLNTDGVNVPNNLRTCTNDAQNKESACDDISPGKRGGLKINGGSGGTCAGAGGLVVASTLTGESLNVKPGENIAFKVTLSSDPGREITIRVSATSSNLDGSGSFVDNAGKITDWEAGKEYTGIKVKNGARIGDKIVFNIVAEGYQTKNIEFTIIAA